METQQLPLNLISNAKETIIVSGILGKILTIVVLFTSFIIPYLLFKCSVVLDHNVSNAKTKTEHQKLYYKSEIRKQKTQIEKRIVLRNKILESIDRDIRLKYKQMQEKVDLVRKKSNMINRVHFFSQKSQQIRFYCQSSRSYPTIPDKEMKQMRQKAQRYEHKTSRSLKYIL